MRSPLIFLLVFTALTGYGQTDTAFFSEASKSTTYFGIRCEAGWNRSWFTSVGVSFLHATANTTHGIGHLVVYASVEADAAPYDNLSPFYGYKGGFEFGTNGTLVGLEVRGYTDFTGREHTVFMPKAGLSVFGHHNLVYGYNVFKVHNNVFGIGRHQVSLSINIARKLFTDSFIPE